MLNTLGAVSASTHTGIDDNDYQSPFRFTGKLDKLTIILNPAAMTADDQKRFNEAAKQMELSAQ
jgi:arylsulfatase